jgi:hypothetical protein
MALACLRHGWQFGGLYAYQVFTEMIIINRGVARRWKLLGCLGMSVPAHYMWLFATATVAQLRSLSHRALGVDVSSLSVFLTYNFVFTPFKFNCRKHHTFVVGGAEFKLDEVVGTMTTCCAQADSNNVKIAELTAANTACVKI